MTERKRTKQTISFNDRLEIFADDLRAKAARLQPGPKRDDLIRKARQADTARNLDSWINSPGLQPPD